MLKLLFASSKHVWVQEPPLYQPVVRALFDVYP